MKYKTNSIPSPTVGMDFSKVKKQCVPNQSMSLQEILLRFTRGEALPIGKDANYSDGPDDLEKLRYMDLVDRAEYVEKLKETQKKYADQEKRKETQARKIAQEKILAEEREKLKAEENSAKAK